LKVTTITPSRLDIFVAATKGKQRPLRIAGAAGWQTAFPSLTYRSITVGIEYARDACIEVLYSQPYSAAN
jgi:hypothetical protein